MGGRWESEENTIDVNEYNKSLLKEDERDRLRVEVTSENLRKHVLTEQAKINGSGTIYR